MIAAAVAGIRKNARTSHERFWIFNAIAAGLFLDFWLSFFSVLVPMVISFISQKGAQGRRTVPAGVSIGRLPHDEGHGEVILRKMPSKVGREPRRRLLDDDTLRLSSPAGIER